MQDYIVGMLHFRANLCDVFSENKKQYYCGGIVSGWAILLLMKSRRVIILYVCRQAILFVNRSVN